MNKLLKIGSLFFLLVFTSGAALAEVCNDRYCSRAHYGYGYGPYDNYYARYNYNPYYDNEGYYVLFNNPYVTYVPPHYVKHHGHLRYVPGKYYVD